MCSVLVIITDILAHQPFEVPFIPYDHMIQQVSPAVANPAFGDSVLPWTAEAGSFLRDAEASYEADDIVVEVCGTVKDQVTGYPVIREGLAKLLSHPCAGGMTRPIEMQNAAPVVSDDKEAIKYAEGQCGNDEEVHRGDGFAVVIQENFPLFRRLWVPRSFSHPPQNSSL